MADMTNHRRYRYSCLSQHCVSGPSGSLCTSFFYATKMMFGHCTFDCTKAAWSRRLPANESWVSFVLPSVLTVKRLWRYIFCWKWPMRNNYWKNNQEYVRKRKHLVYRIFDSEAKIYFISALCDTVSCAVTEDWVVDNERISFYFFQIYIGVNCPRLLSTGKSCSQSILGFRHLYSQPSLNVTSYKGRKVSERPSLMWIGKSLNFHCAVYLSCASKIFSVWILEVFWNHMSVLL